MESGKILIAYADDHDLVRKSVVKNIQEDADIHVIVQGADGFSLLTNIQHFGILPHICLIDMNMPGMGGLELLCNIQEKWPSIKCLVVSAYDEKEKVVSMIKNGIRGYLLKSADPLELVRAIKIIYEGGNYYNDLITEDFFELVKGGKYSVQPFSEIETAFIRLVCEGLTYGEIASQLNMTYRHIDSIRERLFRRLKVTNKAELIKATSKLGI